MAGEWLTDYLDKYEWIGVIPQGLRQSWNSEEHEAYVQGLSTADDVGFTKKMMDYLKQNLNIENGKIYGYGVSNEAVMVYTLARRTDIFSAIIPLCGSMIEEQKLLPETPRLSVFHVHGKKDLNVPYEGGISEILRIPFKSTKKNVEIWARHNGSTKEPLFEKRAGDLSVVRYPDCKDGTNVILYSFDDAPHNVMPKVFEFKLMDEIFSLIAGR